MSEPDDPRPESRRRAHATTGADPALIALGDRARAARIAAGLTQEELALVSGVGRELVIQFENGRSGVAVGHVSRLLGLLGLGLNVVER